MQHERHAPRRAPNPDRHERATNAPISLSGAKLVLEALEQGTTAARKDDIERVIDRALTSEDYRDAAQAFVDKRKPVFKGR